jgi:hypothetical protein
MPTLEEVLNTVDVDSVNETIAKSKDNAKDRLPPGPEDTAAYYNVEFLGAEPYVDNVTKGKLQGNKYAALSLGFRCFEGDYEGQKHYQSFTSRPVFEDGSSPDMGQVKAIFARVQGLDLADGEVIDASGKILVLKFEDLANGLGAEAVAGRKMEIKVYLRHYEGRDGRPKSIPQTRVTRLID